MRVLSLQDIPEKLTDLALKNHTAYHRSIRIKLTVYVLVLIVLTVSLLLWVGYFFAHQILVDEIDQRLTAITSDRQAILQSYIRSLEERINAVSNRPTLHQALDALDTHRITPQRFSALVAPMLQTSKKNVKDFMAIWLTDMQGHVIVSTRPQDKNRSFANNVVFLKGRTDTEFGIPYQNGGDYRTLMSAPIRDAHHTIRRVLLVMLDMDGMMDMLSSQNGLGKTGELLLSTPAGKNDLQLITLSQSHHAIMTIPNEEFPSLTRAMYGHEGFTTARDFQGNTTLLAYQPVGFRNWGIGTQIETQEAYAPILRLCQFLLFLELIILIVSVITAHYLAQRFTRPITALTASAIEVARGNLSTKVQTLSQDELGLLAEAFNMMIDNLGQSYQTLEEHSLALTRTNKDLSQEIRQRKLIEMQLNHAKESAEVANTLKTQFLAIMSHELRTPLNAVIGYSDMLNNGLAGELTEKQRRYVRNIEISGGRLLEMVNKVLEVAELESGRTTAVFQSVEISSVLDAVQTVMGEIAAKAEISLQFSVDPLLPPVSLDGEQFKQILINLVTNAIQFNRPGGTVDIRLFSLEHGNTLVCEVADTGIGIPQDKLNSIFKPFSQLETSYSRSVEGMGLGLVLVKRFVELHGGTITVDSRPGEGSLFRIQLPLQPLDMSAARPTEAITA